MLRRFACPAVLLIASDVLAAPPEMALGDVQLQLDARRHLEDEASPDPYLRFAGFAQLTSGGRSVGGSGAGAGAAVAIGGIGCDLVASTAQARLRASGDPAAKATYALCLSRLGMTLEFAGRRGTGLEPALDARRSLWSRRYREVYDQMVVGFGEIDGHTILLISVGHGTTSQRDGLDERTIKQLDLDVAFYRYRSIEDGSTLEIQTFVLTDNALKAGADDKGGIGDTFLPARLRYESAAYFLGAQAGIGFSGGKTTVRSSTEVNGQTTSSWSETIDATGLPRMKIFVYDVEAGYKRDRLQTSLRLARAFYPTFDGNVAREARVAGTLSYVLRGAKVSLSPFVARTRTWTRDRGSSLDNAVGASVYVGRDVWRLLRVDAIGELGISPYARLDGDRLPQSSLGGQLLVALSGRVTDRQR